MSGATAAANLLAAVALDSLSENAANIAGSLAAIEIELRRACKETRPENAETCAAIVGDLKSRVIGLQADAMEIKSILLSA